MNYFRKSFIDERQFHNIDTPEVAYFLGFLWADGYVVDETPKGNKFNRISISIKSEDAVNLEKVCKRIGSFLIRQSDFKGRKSQTQIYTHHKSLCQHLLNLGYKSKSWASADKILTTIPEHLQHYWFRGLVDGDGCFYHNQSNCYFSVTGAIEQDWRYIEKLFRKLGIEKYRINKIERQTGRNSEIKITNTQEILKVIQYLYQGYPQDDIGLNRKYDKAQKIVLFCKHRKLVKHSKYKYVCYQEGRWISKIKKKRYGAFDTEEEAYKRSLQILVQLKISSSEEKVLIYPKERSLVKSALE